MELDTGGRVSQEVPFVLGSQCTGSARRKLPVSPGGVVSYCRQSEDLLLDRLLLVVAHPGRHSCIWTETARTRMWTTAFSTFRNGSLYIIDCCWNNFSCLRRRLRLWPKLCCCDWYQSSGSVIITAPLSSHWSWATLKNIQENLESQKWMMSYRTVMGTQPKGEMKGMTWMSCGNDALHTWSPCCEYSVWILFCILCNINFRGQLSTPRTVHERMTHLTAN